MRDIAARATTNAFSRGEGQSATCWATFLLRIVKLPGDSIKKTNQTRLANAATEKGIGSQGSKCVVSDFGVSGRSPSVYKSEVLVSIKNGRIDKYKPEVDSSPRLSILY